MKKLFDKYLSEEIKLLETDKILLATSGGADSVAMLDLFSKSEFTCSIAHCNFHLRGSESDGDAQFTENLAIKYNLPFNKTDFETIKFAKEKGISTEMAARELRYTWFEELRKTINYEYIATAHHQDDIIETFFINLIRGTGIRGLSGIKPLKNKVIRPMLFTNRLSIMDYLQKEGIEFRQDSSNLDIKIIRNKLRHQILPLLNEINPKANTNIIKTIENIQDAEYLMEKEVEKAKRDLGIEDTDNFKINIEKLKKYQPVKAYLFEIFRPYGFNNDQIRDIENIFSSEPGKILYSKTHQILKDREELILSPVYQASKFKINISESDELVELADNRILSIQKYCYSSNCEIPKDKQIASIDLDKLKFPLIIRKWEQGDSFYPLGMKKKKKLSDFFIDQKLSLNAKKDILLLISDNQIVWIIGLRIDDRFKITDDTKKMLQITLSTA